MSTGNTDNREERKRRRELIIILITIAVVVLLTFVEGHMQGLQTFLPLSGDVLIFGLININVVLIILLLFLIIRNLVKLIFERRRGILGSRLRTKLVAAFMGLTLIPTVVLFLVTVKFLSYNIDNWFSLRIGSALNYSLEVAQDYYQSLADTGQFYAVKISDEITERGLFEKEKSADCKSLLMQRQKDYNIIALGVLFDSINAQIFITSPNNPDLLPPKLSPKVREDLFMGKDQSLVQSTSMGDVISGVAPLYAHVSPKEVIGIVFVSYFVEKALVDKMALISNTSEEYKQLRLLKTPIKLSYIIMLSIVTLLITFSAIWFGLFLAKGITGPIQDLAEATHAISSGNLDYRIDLYAEDEIGVLVESFNRMTEDLKRSSQSLRQVNEDLDQRRHYMETVLRNVSAGVVSIDRNGIITTINRAAELILDTTSDEVINRRYDDVVNPAHRELVQGFIQELKESGTDFLEKQVQIVMKDRVLTILVAATMVRDEEKKYMGAVVVFEDLSQLQKAERVAAWREVAKKIAHEIKNPLTPVKLNAERLQRKFGDKLTGSDESVFRECTKTITNQVEVLKNLVNEFSRFARMPVSNPSLNDLNKEIEESVMLYQDTSRGLTFKIRKDTTLPLVNFDAEQMKRVMINLIDNAVSALAAVDREGIIEIVTAFDQLSHRARVEVKDNGPGIAPKDKMKIFEPYFSTKKTGTGLGLAIVDSIISDHNGSLSVRDNEPTGTVISFELPIL